MRPGCVWVWAQASFSVSPAASFPSRFPLVCAPRVRNSATSPVLSVGCTDSGGSVRSLHVSVIFLYVSRYLPIQSTYTSIYLSAYDMHAYALMCVYVCVHIRSLVHIFICIFLSSIYVVARKKQ